MIGHKNRPLTPAGKNMTTLDPLDEQRSVRLRQRLWGAAVLISLLVIFLPLLLDGSGSESQYRRVERLRAEPPRIITEDGSAVQTPSAEAKVAPVATETSTKTQVAVAEPVAESKPEPKPGVVELPSENAPTLPTSDAIQAWVVQAGSFKDEANALAVRDKLRRAGFPSFVTPTDTGERIFRVRVGPMISMSQAESSRDKVMRLLQREAIVVSYP